MRINKDALAVWQPSDIATIQWRWAEGADKVVSQTAIRSADNDGWFNDSGGFIADRYVIAASPAVSS